MVMSTTEGMTPVAPEAVLELLREQSARYGRLEALSERQGLLVSGEDVGPLLALLVDRQRVSERLSEIARVLAPIRRDWVEYREGLTVTQRAEADRLLGDAGQRLRRIIDRDEQDARVLSGRKQSVVRELGTTHSTSQAIQAYRAATGGIGRLDCVDEGV